MKRTITRYPIRVTTPTPIIVPTPMAYILDVEGEGGKVIYEPDFGFKYIYTTGEQEPFEWETWIGEKPESDIEVLKGLLNLIKKTMELKKGKKKGK